MFARLAVLVLLGTLATGVAAQNADGRGQATLATLPQSNEALVLSSQVEQALQVGDDRLAIELIDRIMKLPSNLVAAPASRTFYPVWRHAFLLYGRLSERGVELYRQLHDGAVEARFREAAERGDLDTLRSLFHTHRVSAFWQDIGGELVARLLDRGRYGEAIEVLREMRWAGASDDQMQDLQLAVALAQAGAWRAAREISDDVKDRGETRVGTQIDAWLRERGAAAAPAPQYQLMRQGIWRANLPHEGDPRAADLEVFDAIEALQRLPLVTPQSFGSYIVIRSHGRIRALDRLTLTPVWDVPEQRVRDQDLFEPRLPDTRFGRGRRPDAMLQFSPETKRLLGNQFYHLLSGDDERVYSIESLDLRSSADLQRGNSFHGNERTRLPNSLVARDLQTGNLLWRTDTNRGPLAEIEFQDRPLVLGDRLVVPARRNDRVNLFELDARSGQLLREVPIVGPPIHFTHEGGRFLCVADETTIFLTTGNGVVAAVGRDSLEWKWATIYPSTVAEHLGRLWWKPPVEPRESAIDRPILANDLLIMAPIDSLDIFAVDRFSGRERWRLPRREYTHVVGAVSAGLVVGGNTLVCLDLQRPSGPVKWRSVPLEIIGRSVVRGDWVFVPTRRGLVVLDGATGKVLQDQLDPRMRLLDELGQTYAVLAVEDGLFCLNNRQLTKFPAPRATRVAAAEALRGSQAYRGVLGQAWLAALRGEDEQARAMLVELDCEVPAYERSRRQLLLHVYLSLADAAGDPREQIEWLRQADGLAERPGARARLALRIGSALEQVGDWRAAIAHYCKLLEREELVPIEQDSERRVATWLLAQSRLLRLQPHFDEAVDELLAYARQSQLLDLVRIRLHDALPAGAVRTEVAAQLVCGPLPPELKTPYLDEDFAGAALSDDQLRKTLIRRWETLVALGDRERAEEAGLLVAALPQGQGNAGQRQLLRSIRLSAGKLDRGRPPFDKTLEQLSKRPMTELILDSRYLREAAGAWLMVRQHADSEVQMIDVGSDPGFPHRRTQDRLAHTLRDPQYDDLDGPFSDVDQDLRRPFWPMRRTDRLAVVPVMDGLVALGLGPERSGGQRLWDHRVGPGRTVPELLVMTTAVDDGGVCLRSRPGQLMRLGWARGSVHWERDLGKMDIRQLLVCGERLLVRTDDLQVLSCRVEDGGDLQPLPLTDSAQWLDTLDDQVIVATARGLTAFTWDGDAYRLDWARPTERIPQFRMVAGRPWLLLRELETNSWDVLDARTGENVFARPLAPYQTIEHAAVVGERLFVAGRVRGIPAMDDPAEIAAFSPADGTPLWRRQFDTEVSFNPTQLTGHPTMIPLVLQSEERVDSNLGPQLVLVDRQDGQIVHERPLRDDYESAGSGGCDLQVLVAGGQIIIQIERHLLAYGTPEEL